MSASDFEVGIHIYALRGEKPRGMTRYGYSLIQAMLGLKGCPRIHLFTNQPVPQAYAAVEENCVVHRLDARPYLFWEQGALPWLVHRAGVDVFHSATNIGIPFFTGLRMPTLVTVHDLITVKHFDQPLSKLWARGASHVKAAMTFRFSWQVARQANLVIAPSQYSLGEIASEYPELKPKLRCITQGVDARFKPREASGDTKPYFFYVGAFDERKNVGTLVKAFSRLQSNARLLLAGDPATMSKELREQVETTRGVQCLNYVSDEALVELYQGAVAVINPSKAEGFGLQLIEAMACGAPVLCADATSLPEVGGDAAAYFSPEDDQALTALLERALGDRAWVSRARAKGLERAKRFTWEKTARETLELYRGLVYRK
jgi:glycosyltransferase involved in cell wall biosynthesis